MKSVKTTVQVFLSILCFFSFSYGNNIKYTDSIAVSKALGYEISHENFKQNNKIQIDLSVVQKKLTTYLKDNGFKFKFSLITLQKKKGDSLYSEGFIILSDRVNRNIYTQFKVTCLIKNRNLIRVENVALKNNAKPRSLFFIVPASKLDVSQLKNMNFSQALRKVNSVARKLTSFNIKPDLQPRKYKIISFMMNKLDDKDKVYVVFSDTAFSGKGPLAQSFKTKDGWKIFSLETIFAYNGTRPKYFNVLWKKDGYLISLESYSTYSLIKSIQLALSNRGYDVGIINGVLNKKTLSAIRTYLKKSKFYEKSRISDSLLWLMQQYKIKDISKIVQATLLANGINIGKIDGQIGAGTIRGIKKYQKKLGLKEDGRITPELVRLLIQTSANADIYTRLRKNYDRPLLVNQYQNKMWPNELF